MANSFVWYELMTSDVDAAQAFYSAVVGWRGEDANQPGMRYVLMKAGEASAAGLMVLPEELKQSGGRPGWIGYVGVADIDAAVAKARQAGANVHRDPREIPGVGRFAPLSDPQGAAFMLFQPHGDYPAPPPPPPLTPGHVGWHELYTTNWEDAFAFYAAQFGWTKGEAMDMGPMGTYQLFAAGGSDIGGMMNTPAASSAPRWGFYFNVDGSIDAAAARVTAGGGSVVMGPMQVPGGTWMVQCTDPQGAAFALSSPAK